MAREFAAGAKAPAFTLPRDGGATVSLKDFMGRNLVLYFYPEGRHAGLHQGGYRILPPARGFCQGRHRHIGSIRRFGCRPRISSNPSII